jgi:serine/threonine protein kinase/Tfp pilus assembly protein PilF
MTIGSTLDHYQIISKIGSGGMGEVYLAADTRLDRQVALKILHKNAADDKERILRFVQEAKSASALNHPNILTVYEIGHANQSHYIATELIKGKTLRDLLHGEPITLRETLDIATQTAAALNAAHDANLVHRDIKPENLMIRDDGLVKVLDFGLVKLSEPGAIAGGLNGGSEDATKAQINTAPGLIMGTVNYMSPEQARGKETDSRTDSWSLGVVIFEMLTGTTPFIGETPIDTIAAIVTRDPPPLPETVPLELQRIVKKSLQKKADERYQTIKDLLLDVKDLKRELEFSEELERSHIPAFANSSNVSTAQIAGEQTLIRDGSNSTLGNGMSRHPSSAEYIVTEVRKHKFASFAALGVVLVMLIGFGFFYLYSSAGDSQIRSVAVLPFVNVGGNPEDQMISEGVSEALINNLSGLPGLKVIARSSSFKFNGDSVDLESAAKALGVQAIVTGRVARVGDQLQISAEMVNIGDKTQMWGEQFSRKATDLLSVQTEISRHIAEKLRLRLTPVERQQIAKEAKANPEAYELLLKGQYARRSGGLENIKKALEYYEQAIAIDPNYALAYAELASVYTSLAGSSFLDPKKAMPKAEAAAKKALELDADLARAHLSIAEVKVSEWDWAGAERGFERALELNPNLAVAHGSYGDYLSKVGQHERAIDELKLARELDPLRPASHGSFGSALHMARRYDAAIEQFKNALAMDPNSSFPHACLGYTYAAKGQYEQAIGEFQESMKLDGENSSDLCFMAKALAQAGRHAEAEAIRKKLETSKEYVSPAELAVVYIGLDDKERAFASLERAYTARDLQLQFLGVDPNFDDIRSDPRFTELLRRVGLPQANSQ